MAARMVRVCGGEPAVRKGPWRLEEDLVLVSYITEHGEGSWDNLARAAGLNRNGKSCRLRWLNYLRPGVRRGSITPAEDAAIRELQAAMGNKWSKIAKHLPGRTDNEIKNYWRTRIQKRPQQQSRRHLPLTATMAVSEAASSSSSSSGAASQDSSAAAGDCWFVQPKTEHPTYYYYCNEATNMAAATTGVVKSEGATSSALPSQDSSSAGDDAWYTQASYPDYCSASGLGSAADHLGTVAVDAATAQFFPSELSDSFWSVVNNFWETVPVKGAF